MPSKRSSLLARIIGRTGLVLVLAYLALNLGKAIQTNYRTNESIRALTEQITHLEDRINHLEHAQVYYASRSYQELEAKRRLGKKRPGETVVLVPENVDTESSPEPPNNSATSPSLVQLDETSMLEQARLTAKTWIDWVMKPNE
ncbi:septum formation initiator family protein [Candidatus Berkelbacteria bacterium]|nr:septum formation initiator family protein [Candidatus Berkelbacteria bacterium]